MSQRDEFIADLVHQLSAVYEQVDQVDSRTLDVVDNSGYRYLLDVEAVDETPEPLLELLRRWEGRQP